jgi:hypothetical protein
VNLTNSALVPVSEKIHTFTSTTGNEKRAFFVSGRAHAYQVMLKFGLMIDNLISELDASFSGAWSTIRLRPVPVAEQA